MRLFCGYLCREAGLPSTGQKEPDSAAGGFLWQYESYLRKDRGLAENSVHVSVPFIRDFLAFRVTARGCLSPHSWDPLSIRHFVLSHTRDRSAEYVRLLATALRSFFRFLFVSGQIVRDLAPSVPRVCKYRPTSPEPGSPPSVAFCNSLKTKKLSSSPQNWHCVGQCSRKVYSVRHGLGGLAW